MTGIAVYVEGGGDRAQGRSDLRQGMSEFLRASRDAARVKGVPWKLVACGSRNDARDAFLHARDKSPEACNVLLVDSEAAVDGSPPNHLRLRDRWDLRGIDERSIHLMAQVMETWIVADIDRLADYYGQGFLRNAIPGALDLETVSKDEIHKALRQATRGTRKGEYHKIRHSRHLLTGLDARLARLKCSHCERLFVALDDFVGSA